MSENFLYTIEKDEDEFFVGEGINLPGGHAQEKTLDELEERVKEATLLFLKNNKEFRIQSRFVGVHQVAVSTG